MAPLVFKMSIESHPEMSYNFITGLLLLRYLSIRKKKKVSSHCHGKVNKLRKEKGKKGKPGWIEGHRTWSEVDPFYHTSIERKVGMVGPEGMGISLLLNSSPTTNLWVPLANFNLKSLVKSNPLPQTEQAL